MEKCALSLRLLNITQPNLYPPSPPHTSLTCPHLSYKSRCTSQCMGNANGPSLLLLTIHYSNTHWYSGSVTCQCYILVHLPDPPPPPFPPTLSPVSPVSPCTACVLWITFSVVGYTVTSIMSLLVTSA